MAVVDALDLSRTLHAGVGRPQGRWKVAISYPRQVEFRLLRPVRVENGGGEVKVRDRRNEVLRCLIDQTHDPEGTQ